MSFRIKSPTTQWEVLSTLQACVAELRVWMAANKLCLNDAETEFLTLCAPWQRSSVEVSSLGMGLLQVNAVPAARSLGVIMDSALNMEAHIQRLCSRNALGALVASVSQALPPWVGARGNGFYGIDPLNTSLRKYGQQALFATADNVHGNNGNKDTSKEYIYIKKTPVTLMTDSTSFPVASWSFSNLKLQYSWIDTV